jgi:hypothetical protein
MCCNRIRRVLIGFGPNEQYFREHKNELRFGMYSPDRMPSCAIWYFFACFRSASVTLVGRDRLRLGKRLRWLEIALCPDVVHLLMLDPHARSISQCESKRTAVQADRRGCRLARARSP